MVNYRDYLTCCARAFLAAISAATIALLIDANGAVAFCIGFSVSFTVNYVDKKFKLQENNGG